MCPLTVISLPNRFHPFPNPLQGSLGKSSESMIVTLQDNCLAADSSLNSGLFTSVNPIFKLGHYVCRVDGAGFRAEMSILPSAASLWFGTTLAQETLLDL